MQDRLGEMFILGFHGPKVPTWVREFAQNHSLGAVIFFDYYVQTKKYENNIVSREQVRDLCAEVKSLPSKPLVFIDQEGGKVRRLKEKLGFVPFPSQLNFNPLPVSQKEEILDKVFAEFRELGVGFDMTPVIDMNINPQNPDIGAVERSYSIVPEEILLNVKLVAAAARKHNVGLTLKHFPGLGGAKVNSHEELTDISDTIRDDQLELFRQCLPLIPGKGVVMSHGLVTQWGVDPISLSKKAVQMLRGWDPEALLITDDLQMMGMQKLFGTPGACEKGLRAGVDMFCIGNNLLNEEKLCPTLPSVLVKTIESEPSLKAQVEKSLQRIQNVKRCFSA